MQHLQWTLRIQNNFHKKDSLISYNKKITKHKRSTRLNFSLTHTHTYVVYAHTHMYMHKHLCIKLYILGMQLGQVGSIQPNIWTGLSNHFQYSSFAWVRWFQPKLNLGWTWDKVCATRARFNVFTIFMMYVILY